MVQFTESENRCVEKPFFKMCSQGKDAGRWEAMLSLSYAEEQVSVILFPSS